jgi:hypothetical protein
MTVMHFSYKTSQDYDQLVKILNAGFEPICYVDCRNAGHLLPLRVLCKAMTVPSSAGAYFVLSNGSVFATDSKEFHEFCRLKNVEFLVPESAERVEDQ